MPLGSAASVVGCPPSARAASPSPTVDFSARSGTPGTEGLPFTRDPGGNPPTLRAFGGVLPEQSRSGGLGNRCIDRVGPGEEAESCAQSSLFALTDEPENCGNADSNGTCCIKTPRPSLWLLKFPDAYQSTRMALANPQLPQQMRVSQGRKTGLWSWRDETNTRGERAAFRGPERALRPC